MSAGDQAGVIAVGVAALLAWGGGLWRAASLRGDLNSKWAARVALAVASLDEKTVNELRQLRADVDELLPEGGPFDPLAAIVDPGDLSDRAGLIAKFHRVRGHMGADLRRLLRVDLAVMAALVLLAVGTVGATSHYGKLVDASWMRLTSLLVLAAGAAVGIATLAVYVVLQHRLANGEMLAGTAGRAYEEST